MPVPAAVTPTPSATTVIRLGTSLATAGPDADLALALAIVTEAAEIRALPTHLVTATATIVDARPNATGDEALVVTATSAVMIVTVIGSDAAVAAKTAAMTGVTATIAARIDVSTSGGTSSATNADTLAAANERTLRICTAAGAPLTPTEDALTREILAPERASALPVMIRQTVKTRVPMRPATE